MAYLSNTGLTKLVELINTKFETKAALGTAAYQDTSHFALASHGNHVPAKQTASNKVFLRNDNTWQTITPANIGALATTGTAADSSKLGGTAASSYALKTYVDSKVADLVNSAPATLDTLAELSAALGNDPNFATTIATQIGGKVATDSADYIKSASVSGKTLTLTKGDDTTVAFTETNTTYSAGSGLSLSGTTFNHASTITAGTAGTSTATSGITLAVPYVTYNATGHVTAAGTHTHTVPNMTAASASAAGAAGLVKAPAKGDQNKFLRGNATWATASDIINTLSEGTSAAQAADYVVCQYAGGGTTTTTYHRRPVSKVLDALTKAQVTTALGYTPPTTNTTYSNMTAATADAAGKAGLVPAPAKGKQTSFLRGDGTWVVPTNTTYSNMTAATADAAGKAGLVPAPGKGKQTSFLRGDGTWVVPTNTTNSAGAGNSTAKLFLVGTTAQSTGTSYSNANVYATNGALHATSISTGGNVVVGGTANTNYLQLPSGIKLY